MTKPDAMAARKKDKEENETLDDLEHNEDGRGCCYQPLLKTYPEAADRSPSSIANVLRDLMRGGQQELRTGIASHFSPGLAALPHFQTMFFFGGKRGDGRGQSHEQWRRVLGMTRGCTDGTGPWPVVEP